MATYNQPRDAPLFGGRLLEEPQICLDWKHEAARDDYFFWQSEEEKTATIPELFDNASPLPPTLTSPATLIYEHAGSPPELYSTPTPSPQKPATQETDNFDLDAFVSDYLSSPQGQQILEEDITFTTESLLFPDDILRLVEQDSVAMDMTYAAPQTYVVDIASLMTNKEDTMTVNIPSMEDYDEATMTDMATTTTTASPESNYESDISGEDDTDPDWNPGKEEGSEDEASRTKTISRGRVTKTESFTRQKYGPRKPRSIDEKRERKKGQNRTAALRYRERMRQEQGDVSERLAKETATNIRLQARVDTMRKDIEYFKQLMLTVLHASG